VGASRVSGGVIDRRYYELCVLSELRDRLRAGDVWVVGSRRYRSFDESRALNNGQPSLWASLLDHLNLSPGEHALHLGCGTGYYSAILAELVGTQGVVTALEIDERAHRPGTQRARTLASGHRDHH
jgi:cyclopropane fatty-acyl-phospholipid synthase-like methyltransferase